MSTEFLLEFRQKYPQGSVQSELIDIDRGVYLVKVSIAIDGIILATGLAGEKTIEKAENVARERALKLLVLENGQISPILGNKKDLSSSKINSLEKTLKSDRVQKIVTQSEVTTPTEDYSTNTIPINSSSQTTELLPLESDYNNSRDEYLTPPPENYSSQPVTDLTEEYSTNIDSINPDLQTTDTLPLEPDDTDNGFNSSVENLPSQSPTKIEDSNVVVDFKEIRYQTDIEMKRLGWTKEQGKDYLLQSYGKKSRIHLTDEELIEFLQHLKSLS